MKWGISERDLLRDLVTRGEDWRDIARALNSNVSSVKTRASMLGYARPLEAREHFMRAPRTRGPVVSTPVAGELPGPIAQARESAMADYFTALDQAYVRALVDAGGFARAEIVHGRTVLVYATRQGCAR